MQEKVEVQVGSQIFVSKWSHVEKNSESQRGSLLHFIINLLFIYELLNKWLLCVCCVFSVFIKKFTNARDEKWIWHVDPWGMSNIVFRQIFTHSLKQAVWQYAKEKCLMPAIIYILHIIQGDDLMNQKAERIFHVIFKLITMYSFFNF